MYIVQMTSSTVVSWSLACLLLSSCLVSASKHPHIVYILADDLGFDDVSFRGSLQIPTPNIDSLAYDGIILNHYYVQYICTPSRASLLTGRHPIHLGMQNGVVMAGQPFGVSLEEKLLPQYLKELKYDTHMIGKWHLGYHTDSYLPTSRGFDSYYGYLQGAETYYSHNCTEEGHWGLDWWKDTTLLRNESGLYSTESFTRRAEHIINTHDTDKALFLYFAQQATHASTGPIEMEPAPDRYQKQFHYINDKARRYFAGMLSALDDSVGNITAALHKRGMLNNTIIVFSTDNGGAAAGVNGNSACNWPLRGTKYLNWEGGVRGVGFIWSTLLKNSGYVSNQLMHLVDWLPTLLHAVGYNMKSLPDKVDGIDYWDVLSNETKGTYTLRQSLVLNIDNVSNTMAIREGDIKLIKGYSGWSGYSGWYPPPQVYADSALPSQGYNASSSKDSLSVSTNNVDHTVNFMNAPVNQQISVDKYLRLYEQSTTRQALNDLGRPHRKPKPARIDCKIPKPANASSNCDLKKFPCVYNVTADPCEYENLVPTRPDLLILMLQRLADHMSSVVHARNQPFDPHAAPEKHGNAWVPWLNDTLYQ